MGMLDFLFNRFRFYRRWRGGHWVYWLDFWFQTRQCPKRIVAIAAAALGPDYQKPWTPECEHYLP